MALHPQDFDFLARRMVMTLDLDRIHRVQLIADNYHEARILEDKMKSRSEWLGGAALVLGLLALFFCPSYLCIVGALFVVAGLYVACAHYLELSDVYGDARYAAYQSLKFLQAKEEARFLQRNRSIGPLRGGIQ